MNATVAVAHVTKHTSDGPHQNWAPPAPRWVIADTHFLLPDEGYRPPDADAFIKAEWQRLVKPNDALYHLGDVGIAPRRLKDALVSLLKELPGVVTLIPGNWDAPEVLEVCAAAGWRVSGSPPIEAPGRILAPWEPRYQDIVEVDGRIVQLSHYPAEDLPGSWFSVHGHLHPPGSPPYEKTVRHINVAAALNDWRPVDLEHVIRNRVRQLPRQS